MLIKDPPVEITDNLLMLGTNAYPLYLYKGQQAGVATAVGGARPSSVAVSSTKAKSRLPPGKRT